MTHLARADERDRADDRASSSTRFESALIEAGVAHGRAAPGDQHRQLRGHPGLAAMRRATGCGRDSRCTASRLSAAKPRYTHGLKPVMTLETTVLTVRDVKRGETVGYAGAWRAERDSTIAILAAGYGDGLPRHLANGTPVLIGGARHPNSSGACRWT